MAGQLHRESDSRGVNISGSIGSVGGDIIGGDHVSGNKFVYGLTSEEVAALLEKTLKSVNKLKVKPRRFATRRKKLFLEHFEPAYNSLMPLIDSYYDEIVRLKIAWELAPADDAFKAAVECFKNERLRLARTRNEILASVDATLDYWNRKEETANGSPAFVAAIAFVDSIHKYFFGTYFKFSRKEVLNREKSLPSFTTTISDAYMRPLSIMTSLIDLIEAAASCRFQAAGGRRDALLYDGLAHAVLFLEDRRTDFQKSFFALRLECLDRGA